MTQASYVVKDDIELTVVLPLPLNSGVVGVYHYA